MSRKYLGADIIAFFKEWPPGEDAYMEEAPFETTDTDDLLLVSPDDESGPKMDPAVKYLFGYGLIGWQGEGDPPAGWDDDMPRVFRKWLKARTVTTLIVEVPNDKAADLRASLLSQGFKVTL